MLQCFLNFLEFIFGNLKHISLHTSPTINNEGGQRANITCLFSTEVASVYFIISTSLPAIIQIYSNITRRVIYNPVFVIRIFTINYQTRTLTYRGTFRTSTRRRYILVLGFSVHFRSLLGYLALTALSCFMYSSLVI